MQVTAAVIETDDQADHVHNRGCTLGRGHYFAKPLPPGDASDCSSSIG
jgi:EAL domain-containing protein (putative c-di-GMP-specific phosphodiesterase class I)